MKAHLISDKIYYLSLEQNNFTFEMKQSMKNTNTDMEQSRIDTVMDYLNKKKDLFFIIDAFNIQPKLSTSNIDSIICERFAILGINEKTFNVICEYAKKKDKEISFIKYNLPLENDSNKEDYYIVLFDHSNLLWNYINTNVVELNNKEIIREFIDIKCVRNIIAAMLKKDIETYSDEKWSYLESSNVYIKNYLNVKCLFAVPNAFDLILLKMRELIEQVFMNGLEIKEREKICLLGVSNNGIILSRILAYIMEMNSKSINHLGPMYCMEGDIEDLEKYRNNLYILISDVICLGGEYRMTKGIVSILGSRLLGAVGIVKVRDVYRNEKKSANIATAVLEEIEQYGIKYNIYIDREEDNSGC